MNSRTFTIKTIVIALIAALIVSFSWSVPLTEKAYAADGLCRVILGDNDSDQDYWRWSEPIRSYLIKEGSQLMRVQASDEDEGKFQATYYDPSTYKAVSRKTIYTDLPIFGGFATDGTYYYVVTGQNNTGCSDSVEVFRITKYDKNWKSLGFSRLYGANTKYPFDAGSCRFAFSGNYMVVRTAHEMYSGHQANVTILYDKANNSIKASQTEVANYKTGYVSHSFNQFVQINNNKIVAVDHGDANDTRALVLLEYPSAITTNSLPTLSTANKTPVTMTKILSFAGSSGDNETGATVGAFEMNSSNYFIAYNTVVQDSNFANYDTRNLYVAVVNKNTKEITQRKITNYSEGEGNTSTPHLVAIGGGSYLLLWNEGNEVYGITLNANGTISSLKTLVGSAYLSDCKPLYDSNSNKVIWYNYDDDEEEFYELDLYTMSLTKHDYSYKHNHVYDSTSSDGYATMKCTNCGNTYKAVVPIDFTVKWNLSSSYYFDEAIPKPSYKSTVYYDFSSISYAEYNYNIEKLSDMVFTADDPVNCHVDESKKTITFDKAGTYSFTAYPKYNPTLKKSYTLVVGEPLSKVTLSADKTTIKPGETVQLTAVSEGGAGIVYSFHAYTNTYGYESYYDTIRSAETSNSCEWTPQYGGTYIVKVLAQDSEGDMSEAEDKLTINVSNSSTSSSDTSSDDDSDSGISLPKYATVSKISNRTYSGKKIKPTPTVKCFGVTLVRNRDYKITYSKCKNVGTATVKITGMGTYSGTIKKTFKIRPKSTKVNKLTPKRKAIKVTWTKKTAKMSKSRITGYQIQYSTSSKFKSAKKITVKGYKKSAYTIKKLKAKKKYYVRVRTYMKVGKKTYYSTWSKKKSIKTK